MDSSVPGTVLVVEDDEALRETIVMTLELSRIATRAAANGVEALASIAESMPALILLDMRMPTMDGWEFSRQFQARYAERPPVIVVTAAEDARRRAEEIQACCSIGKPFDVDVLVAMVTEHLGGEAHRERLKTA
jgi:DNA-binding response OmpR family regulator